MKIASVKSYQTSPNFAGENLKKNKIKNAAGAAVIALAVAAPVEKADAQIYYYSPVNPYNYYVPAPSPVTVPDCFVVGNKYNVNLNKTMDRVFDEIDCAGNRDGELTSGEVLRTERLNWNLNYMGPYNVYQMNNTKNQFRALSEMYNEENSNPKTINYNEYKAIMNDYLKARDVNNFINLMRLFTAPAVVCPPHIHQIPPHHRHRH